MKLTMLLAVAALSLLLPCATTTAQATDPIEIANRRELFVDNALVEKLTGDVQRQLKQPKPEDVVFETDEVWEGNTSGYYTLFQDDDIYRMIYRGWQHDPSKKAAHAETTCYAESKDGIHWTKPNLGQFEWNGSKDNNICWLGPASHNFTAFRDANPNAHPSQQYKALGRTKGGLLAFTSPDCKTWTLAQKAPVITNGAFDSQNLAFWDAERQEYRAYWRYFAKGVRAIRTATSKDFLKWENEADVRYPNGTPAEHLYTNAIQKYFRAPHLFVGFPTRYEPRSQQVEPILMSSRDGVLFQRFQQPVIPRTAPKDRNHNRSNYMAWGMFTLPGKPKEIAVYGTENYYESTPGRLRRFTYRLDGFVALVGGEAGGVCETKRLKVAGANLELNYVTLPGGTVIAELIDNKGEPIAKSIPMKGDETDHRVRWQAGAANDIDSNGNDIRLRLTIKNAEVYSFRFAK